MSDSVVGIDACRDNWCEKETEERKECIACVIVMGIGDVLSGVNVGRGTDQSLAAYCLLSLFVSLSELISGSCRCNRLVLLRLDGGSK